MILILAAMDVEIQKIAEQMQGKKETAVLGRTYFTGTVGRQDVTVASSSIGKVNAALTCQNAISAFHPDFVIHTGIAGGLSGALSINTVVLGQDIAYHDFEESVKTDYFPNQAFFHSDKRLMALAQSYFDSTGESYQAGLIVTGDRFITSDKQKSAILSDHPSALCVDMESCAIAHTCFINGVPFLVMRTVSDFADDDGYQTYKQNKRSAADMGAGMVLDLLGHLDGRDR